ncbi:type VI secretion system baseplate subunit TssK [Niveispirillum irakense]|uniref:type VI secretion system baseplate subunit TssK n=1 Tax=Niveispirillum irakense TaxID=34011 RepID=UPI00040C0234|nr:type VI secretion system baseplate subunit TssK [Niveispirillum irakense]
MSVGRAIFWNEGLYLTPQHFQRQDWHQQQRLRAWMRAVAPDGWGVASLSLRAAALAVGTLEVAACEVITREGTLIRGGVDVADGNAMLPVRQLSGQRGGAGSISLYLALPRADPAAANILDEEALHRPNTTPRRFIRRHSDHADLYEPQAGDKAIIHYADHYVRLIVDGDPEAAALADWEYLEIARLDLKADGALVPAAGFIPSCLHIAASPALRQMASDLRDLIHQRTREFASLKSEAVVQGQASRSQDVMRHVILLALNRAWGSLSVMMEDEKAHPRQLHHALRLILAELSTFTPDLDALGDMPGRQGTTERITYDHGDLTGSFTPLVQMIRRIVTGLSISNEDEVRLAYDGRAFGAAIPPAFFGNAHARYYLLVDTALAEEQLQTALVDHGKLVEAAALNDAIARNLRGVPLKLQSAPPGDLPPRAHTVCLRIDQTNPLWQRIGQTGQIRYMADALAVDDMVLLVRTTG